MCYGVWGKADAFFIGGSGFGGVGVRGDGTNTGVLGIGPQFGVYGQSAGVGVQGASSGGGTGVEGSSSGIGAVGVKGSVTGGSTFGIGVLAEADGPDIALQANSANGDAIQGISDNGTGVYGTGLTAIWGQGQGGSSTGVRGIGSSSGVRGTYSGVGAGYAGYFEGGAVFSQGGFVPPSDLRLKHDVRDLETALETVMSLRPVRFVYNDLPGERIGLIAQEVQELLPELVIADPTTEEGMLGLNYTELIPVLIKAIQELQAEVEALKAAQP